MSNKDNDERKTGKDAAANPSNDNEPTSTISLEEEKQEETSGEQFSEQRGRDEVESGRMDVLQTPKTHTRHQEEENEAVWSKAMPSRSEQSRLPTRDIKLPNTPDESATNDIDESDMQLPAPLLQSQSTPGAFRMSGISADTNNTCTPNIDAQMDSRSLTGDQQSTTTSDTSVLAMVPPRYSNSHFSGVPSNWSRDEDNDTSDLHSLVPVEEHGSRPASALSQSFDSSLAIVEAQVVSDHFLEQRVRAEVEARLQQEVHQRMSTIATAEVIGTGSGRPTENTTATSSVPPSTQQQQPSLQRVDIDIENDSITNGKEKNTENAETEPKHQRQWCLWIVFILVGVLCATGGAVAAILLTGDDIGDETPTTAPFLATLAPSIMPAEVSPPSLTSSPFSTSPPSLMKRLEDMQEVLSVITNSGILLEPSSPQHSAMLWLVYDDGLQLEPVSSYELFQRYILATLYFSTQGSRWKNKCRFLSASSVCDWQVESLGQGVYCRNGTFEAERIQFVRNGLRGSLPSEFSFMETLEAINMHDNDLSGEVPGMKSLIVLELGRNVLTSLPEELSEMTRLTSLAVDSNRLLGSIPNISALTALIEIRIGDNRLSSLPLFPEPTDETLPQLRTVSVELNRLVGPVDPSICNLKNLDELSIYANELTSLPECLGGLEKLQTVYIHQNSFQGDIDSIFCPLQEGQIVEADCFTRVVCTCCTSCCDSPENECYEQTDSPTISTEAPSFLPTSVSNAPSPLPSFNASASVLPTASPVTTTPTIAPSTLTPSEALGLRFAAIRDVLLQVSDPQLLNDVSSSQYETMKWIVEDDPAQILPENEDVLLQRYIVSLIYFAMNGAEWWDSLNFLSASNICDWNDGNNLGCFCSDTADKRLYDISLFENNLYFQLPNEIFYLTDLQTLHLDGNAIDGSIASSIGSLTNLRTLTLDFNLLGSAVPSELGHLAALEVLWLNDNFLSGGIPSEIGKLTRLKEIAFENNRLTGTVPLELRNIRLWEFVYLEGNSLRGDLDPVFCPLDGPNLDLWADCGVGLEVDCTCCTFCCYFALGCFEN